MVQVVEEQMGRRGEAVHPLRPVLHRTLADVQERLTFRAQAFIKVLSHRAPSHLLLIALYYMCRSCTEPCRLRSASLAVSGWRASQLHTASMNTPTVPLKDPDQLFMHGFCPPPSVTESTTTLRKAPEDGDISVLVSPKRLLSLVQQTVMYAQLVICI